MAGIALFSAAFALAFACVALMGYAIQRGATCTVAAVDEVLTQRSARRLLGMAEASLWVAGGLVVAQAFGRLPQMPAGWVVSGWTVAGGVLLGFGAWVNRACVFGAIARLGSGEWAYVLTPVGYFAGCWLVPRLFGMPAQLPLDAPSPLLAAPAWAALPLFAWALWRLQRVLRSGATLARVWTPHAATTVIGLTFLVTLLVAGAWAYTDLLAELAHGGAAQLPLRLGLFAALLGGAALGGWTAGRWRPTVPGPATLARCFGGGALMGAGTLLIPGSNDGLVLVGMPLLRPYAWLAFATMCLTIAAAITLQRWRARLERPGVRAGA
jgi:hypothetical protein